MLRSNRFWLRTFTGAQRKAILRAMHEQHGTLPHLWGKATSRARFLINSISWAHTAEGWAYWRDLYLAIGGDFHTDPTQGYYKAQE